ncbi:hypothetical protein [Paenibacillus sp. Marseille-Q4541]|uniref:hypothetical protein n=1 Tax=Paenibacillus sp. Marseille-Q4541 TaxID=2831522 RepID=UPI001BA491F3|nr:hypothetical protein [Paenibacillus sp. Marseille-Q4541]
MPTKNIKLKQWGRKEAWKVEDFNSALTQIDEEVSERGTNVNWFKKSDSSGLNNDLVTYINKEITNNPDIYHMPFGNITVNIPAGEYTVTDINLLKTTLKRVRGLNLRGTGREVTRIIFKPSANNQYLFNNNDCWLHIHFEDMTFFGDLSKNANFMLSTGAGGAQNYTFSRVNFRNWNWVCKLEGTDNNSEFTFFHCGFYGTIRKVLFVEDQNGSDQFLNYNFFACQYEVEEGDFIDMAKGGNINIWGGSFIHIGANGGTFFKLLGKTHSLGVTRFLCIGARFEHRTVNSKLIRCEWDKGNVSFISCDCSSQALNVSPNSKIATFVSENVDMPIINFDNCTLMGTHQFQYYAASAQKQPRITYENCDILNHQTIGTFIELSAPDNNASKGAQPTIHFKNCRAKDSRRGNVWDCDYNFQNSYTGITQKRIVSLKNADGKFPYQLSPLVDCYLPLGSIITNIRLYSPAGAVTENTDATFTVQTTESTPTVLGIVNALDHSLGFDLNQPLLFSCDSEAKRHIQLVATNVAQANGQALCLIEYIG